MHQSQRQRKNEPAGLFDGLNLKTGTPPTVVQTAEGASKRWLRQRCMPAIVARVHKIVKPAPRTNIGAGRMKRLLDAFEGSASRLIRNLYLLAGALGLAYAVSQGSVQTVTALCYVLLPL